MSAKVLQHRHHLNLPSQDAKNIYDLFDIEFEEDGIAVSLFELDGQNNIWCVGAYADLAQSQAIKQRMANIIAAQGIGTKISTQEIVQTDWVAQTLNQLSPVRGGRFVVHGSHDCGVAKPNDIAITIDAGLAFGTGHHGTTAGCLDLLDDELKRRKFTNPLDLGTGSGVLAIALAKASKGRVVASDIDPVAARIASQNAAINGVGNLVTCLTARGFNHREITSRAPFDLIIANILARPLQKLAVDFSRNVAPGAVIIVSGLLPHQKARIVATFQGFGMYFVKAHIRDGWLSLQLCNQRRPVAMSAPWEAPG